jgi:hypothetical protein
MHHQSGLLPEPIAKVQRKNERKKKSDEKFILNKKVKRFHLPMKPLYFAI